MGMGGTGNYVHLIAMERGEGSRRPTASVRRRYDEDRARARSERLEQLRQSDPTAVALFDQTPHPAPAPDDDNGGPYDNSLLPHFENHIARRIWDDRNAPTRVLTLKYHSSNLHSKWSKTSLPVQLALWIQESKFAPLADHAYSYIDAALVSAFVERWQPETNTFHMPFGEMTITLDDVQQILGLLLMGRPVHISSSMDFPDGKDIDWASIMDRGIGVDEEQARYFQEDSENILLTSVRKLFMETNYSAAELASVRFRRKQFTAWMFYMLATVAFPNKSGSKFPVWYMYFVMEHEEVQDYAWGVAILAFLYRELGNASRATTKQMSGCLTLLLCWIFEHFPNIRRPSFDIRYIEENPRMLRWNVSRAQDNQQESLLTYRHLLDEMDPNSVVWDPYREQRTSTRPIPEETWYKGVLVCLEIIEPYNPERVLWQFGRIQTIPRNPLVHPTYEARTSSARKEMSLSFVVNQLDQWRAHLLDMPRRSTVSEYMSQTRVGYQEWFYKHSHPRIHRGELFFRLPVPERGVQEERYVMDIAIDKATQTLECMERADMEKAKDKRKLKWTMTKLRQLLCLAGEGDLESTEREIRELESDRYF